MTRKEFKQFVNKVDDILYEDYNQALEELFEIIDRFFKNQEYKAIADLYSIFSLKLNGLESFEIAYSLVEAGQKSKGEKIYEALLKYEPNSSTLLNNLSNLKKLKGEFSVAYKLIEKAYEIDPEDSIISRNYNEIKDLILEEKSKDQDFKNSTKQLTRENNFVIEKLQNFLKNVKKEEDFSSGKIAIPNWKFKVLMGTDTSKADSLKRQWVDKNYLANTKIRNHHNVIIYEINPYLKNAIAEITLKQINNKWIQGFENVTVDKLEAIKYYDKLKKIRKINRKYRSSIERDYDELVFNYLVGNYKTVIILSGSLLEILMIYFLYRKRVQTVEYSLNNRVVTKNIFKAVLNDLLQHFEEKNLISKQNFHLGNVSRIYRNFIHPGKEVKEQEKLDAQKAEISFMSVMELIDTLI